MRDHKAWVAKLAKERARRARVDAARARAEVARAAQEARKLLSYPVYPDLAGADVRRGATLARANHQDNDDDWVKYVAAVGAALVAGACVLGVCGGSSDSP